MKTFPDVDYTRWYGEAIKRVSELGIMIGDDKGNFRPNEPLTRGEAAQLACNILDYFEKKHPHRR